MTNVLFIAFEFPPLVRGGVHRPLAFSQHFARFGINPIVITLDKGSYAHTFDVYGVDEMLAGKINKDITVISVPADKPRQRSRVKEFYSIYFSILGNEVKYWKDNFYRAVDKAVKEYSPRAILVTVPPFSALELAATVAKKYNLPLISDFRDAFSQWRATPYGSFGHYLKTLQVERKYLKASDAIVATSRQTLDDFRRLHPGVEADRFHYIPNGYSGELDSWKPLDPGRDQFVIGYVGSFYYSPEAREQMLQPWWKKKGHRMLQYIPMKQDWLYRSPWFFFRALQRLNEQNPGLGRRISVKFAGKTPPWLIGMIESFGLKDQVTLMGEVPHHRSLEFQRECDALLITSAKQLGGRDYSIAGKTFEYLQIQRPVVAFVCDGAQKDLLEEAGTALICDPDDPEQAVSQLAEFFGGRTVFTPNYSFLNTLTRAELTHQMSDLIVNAIKQHEIQK